MYIPKHKFIFLIAKHNFHCMANRYTILKWAFDQVYGYDVGIELIWRCCMTELQSYIRHINDKPDTFLSVYFQIRSDAMRNMAIKWDDDLKNLQHQEILQILSYLSNSTVFKDNLMVLDMEDPDFNHKLVKAYLNDEFESKDTKDLHPDDHDMLQTLLSKYCIIN